MNFTFDLIKNIRKILKDTVESTTLEDLNKIPKGFNNNIIWNIGHIVVIEQLLTYKLSGLKPVLSDQMIDKYKKGTKPEGQTSEEEVGEIKQLLISTLESTKKDYAKGHFKDFNSYTVSTTGNTLNNIDEALQFVLVHDAIHYGCVLALLKAVNTKLTL